MTTTTYPATDKQIGFIKKLCAERNIDVPTAGLSKKAASALIDNLLKQPKAQKAAPSEKAVTVTETGVYDLKGTFYLVKRSKQSKRLYAYELIIIDGTETTVEKRYAPGKIYDIKPENKLTQAVAAEFGLMFGVCICCGRKLEDKEHRSQVAGYGKTCAAKHGWWYPTAKEAANMIQMGMV